MTTSRLLVEALSSPVDLAILFLAALGAFWAVARTVEALRRPRAATPPPALVPATGPAPAPVSVAAIATAVAEVPAELLAVIAAAVYATLGPGHEIVAIESGGQPFANPQILAWSAEGRRTHYASHKVR
jgi:hypothetical protein